MSLTYWKIKNLESLVELICQEVAAREGFDDFPGYVRRTCTICIYADDRPGIKSKDLVHITVVANGVQKSGTFCVDAIGSRSGHIIASSAHLRELGLVPRLKADVSIRLATAAECVAWLKANADPERQALGFMLAETIEASAAAKKAADEAKLSSEAAFRAADSAADAAGQARNNYMNAITSEHKAEVLRKRGYFYTFFAFIFGAFLDVGMIEEKFGFMVPSWSILLLIIVAVFGCVIAQKIKK